MQVDTKKVATVKGQLTKAKKVVEGFEIKTVEDYELAGKKFIELKKLSKEFNKEKKEWLDPINLLRAKIFSYTKPVEDGFKKLLGDIDTSMRQWEIKIEEERQAEAKAIEEKVDNGEMKLADATNAVSNLEAVEQVETDKGKIHQRVSHELVLDDITQVSTRFLMVNMPMVKADYQATGQVPAGFKLEQKVSRVTRLS